MHPSKRVFFYWYETQYLLITQHKSRFVWHFKYNEHIQILHMMFPLREFYV